MLTDILDYQWFSIDLHTRVGNLDKSKNRLRSIASQKSEPKPGTIHKHITQGDIALKELKILIDTYFKDKELQKNFCVYFEDIELFWDEAQTFKYMQYQQYRMEDYEEIKERALVRLIV